MQLMEHVSENVIVTQMRVCAAPDADYYVTGECRLTSEAARGSGGLGASSAELVRDGSLPLWTRNDYNKDFGIISDDEGSFLPRRRVRRR
jgi:hypothetical protein